MKSAGYTVQYCAQCRWHRYASGYDTTVFPRSSWYYEWARQGESRSGTYTRMKGRCAGCGKVAVVYAQVLAILLWKMGVQPCSHEAT